MNDVSGAMGVAPVLLNNRCVVCVGPGGVGKTSTAAAMSMYAAATGKRTVVLTIDPARRLANALGLAEIGSVERPVPTEAFERAGLDAPKGRLTAMMLDIKQAWDEVIVRYHPDPGASTATDEQSPVSGDVDRPRRIAGVHGDGEAPCACDP